MQDPQRARRGFTLIELLVAIAIIVILIGILIPTVRHVTGASKEAVTRAFIAELSAAFDEYYNTFNAYPGPLSNNEIHTDDSPYGQPPIDIYSPSGSASWRRDKITANENSVVGILGGLRLNPAGTRILFDKDLIGKGPLSLNPRQPRQYAPLITSASLSSGRFSDESGEADDSEIPDFVDRFTNPMPLLILRPWPGRTAKSQYPINAANNYIITDGTDAEGVRGGHYQLCQIIGYTGAYSGDTPDANTPPSSNTRSIGVGKTLTEVYTDGTGTAKQWKNKPAYHGLRRMGELGTAGPTLKASEASASTPYYYPYDAYAYFTNYALPVPTQTNPNVIPTPRQKDRYIIISAGKDRVYGTDDDITNFGSVGAP